MLKRPDSLEEYQRKQRVKRASVMDQAQLCQTIRVLIDKGDQATEKAEQFYISAGQHLKSLREDKTKTEFEAVLKQRKLVGLSRAYELMKLADRTRSLGQMRAMTDQRKKKHRKNKGRPFRNGQTNGADKASEPSATASKPKATTSKPGAVMWTFSGMRKKDVSEANDVIALLIDFQVELFNGRAEWRKAIRTDEDRKEVAHALHQAANELAMMAQVVSGIAEDE
jgi:hypothetical protein